MGKSSKHCRVRGADEMATKHLCWCEGQRLMSPVNILVFLSDSLRGDFLSYRVLRCFAL